MAPRWIDTKSRYAEITAVDPYIDLAFATEEASFFACERQRPWLSVLLRLQGISAGAFAAGSFNTDPAWQESWQQQVHVPTLYRRPIAGLEDQEYCTAYVRHAEFFDSLHKMRSLQNVLARVTPGQFFEDYVPPAAAGGPGAEEPESVGEPEGDPEPGMVVMGIIDDGIAFAHERFRRSPCETRVEYVWLQDGESDPIGSPVPYGRELRKQDKGGQKGIDTLLRESARAGAVDEDDLYRRAGAIDFSRRGRQSVARRAAHGTHVMDLACGYDPRKHSRDDRPIICVQLPAATTEDTSGATLDDYGLDAIRYILDRADNVARQRPCGRLPVVINLSYGNVAGPHDGSSSFEAAIDELVRARPNTRVVLPAGNSHLARLHAEVRFEQPGQTVVLHWRVLPDDRTPSFMEIWLPRAAPDQKRVRLRVRPPYGDPSGWLEEDSGSGLRWASNGAVLCEARYRHIPEPTKRGMFLVALQPTTSVDPTLSGAAAKPAAPSGLWTIELENVSLKGNDLVEAWIQRDDTPFGFRRRGRQSYFDEPCYERFDAQGRAIEEDNHPQQRSCQIKRAGSINAIATGRETIVVGGKLRKEKRRARYSAEGAPGSPAPHDLRSEVSDDSLVHRGVRGAGTRSGSVILMDGTSVAAPQIARRIADILSGGIGGVVGPFDDRPPRFQT